MTGYRSKHFRHDCQRQGCYVQGLPSWDWLIDQLPRKIRPTDVDGFIEINGHVLIIEEKQAGKAPEEGQRRALKVLGGLPNVVVIFMRPLVGDEDALEVLRFPDPDGWQRSTKAEFLSWVLAWCVWADGTPPIVWTEARAVA